jgi:hypothetical protein
MSAVTTTPADIQRQFSDLASAFHSVREQAEAMNKQAAKGKGKAVQVTGPWLEKAGQIESQLVGLQQWAQKLFPSDSKKAMTQKELRDSFYGRVHTLLPELQMVVDETRVTTSPQDRADKALKQVNAGTKYLQQLSHGTLTGHHEIGTVRTHVSSLAYALRSLRKEAEAMNAAPDLRPAPGEKTRILSGEAPQVTGAWLEAPDEAEEALRDLELYCNKLPDNGRPLTSQQMKELFGAGTKAAAALTHLQGIVQDTQFSWDTGYGTTSA